jgi:hypothetical protein
VGRCTHIVVLVVVLGEVLTVEHPAVSSACEARSTSLERQEVLEENAPEMEPRSPRCCGRR